MVSKLTVDTLERCGGLSIMMTSGINRRYAILVFFIILGSICICAPVQSASELKLDQSGICWNELSFHAKNFWVEVSSRIRINSLAASELEPVLVKAAKGNPIQPATRQAAQLTIQTTIDPKFRSPVNIYNRTWFDPTDASALGRVRIRRGEDDFKKNYRFTDQGVFRHRIEPKNKTEALLSPEKWTDTKDDFYSFIPNERECPVVTERSLLIYILSATHRLDKEAVSLCVFGKRQLHRVQIRNKSLHSIRINYTEKSEQSEMYTKEGTLQALKFAITAEPIEPGRDPEKFSLLGFHKNIAIYVDPSNGLPVQVSGAIPSIGKADLKLNQVRYKGPSD